MPPKKMKTTTTIPPKPAARMKQAPMKKKSMIDEALSEGRRSVRQIKDVGKGVKEYFGRLNKVFEE